MVDSVRWNKAKTHNKGGNQLNGIKMGKGLVWRKREGQ